LGTAGLTFFNALSTMHSEGLPDVKFGDEPRGIRTVLSCGERSWFRVSLWTTRRRITRPAPNGAHAGENEFEPTGERGPQGEVGEQAMTTDTKVKTQEDIEKELKEQREEKEKLADAQGKGKTIETPMGPTDYSGTKYSPNAPDGEPMTEAQAKAHEADVHPSQKPDEGKAKSETRTASHETEHRTRR
jgi:hypothetical protein